MTRRLTRTVRLAVRLMPQEDATLRARARECGMTRARYLRETALSAVPKARPRQVELEAVRELARLGNLLNQVARLAHEDGEVEPHEVRAVLEEILVAARRLG